MVRLVLLGVLFGLCVDASAAIVNGTGLPAYPNLDSAAMDPLLHTETFGRWCARFTATTSDSLLSVETWYRRTLRSASESDLAKDRDYSVFSSLSGIKLVVGIDYVTVFRVANAPTVIELHRCGWNH